jgi:Cep192 domain 4/Right handed beta helix region/Abnormal spindle-like microcephaly-assoc'd, ASPM-SPD-2-Hydin
MTPDSRRVSFSSLALSFPTSLALLLVLTSCGGNAQVMVTSTPSNPPTSPTSPPSSPPTVSTGAYYVSTSGSDSSGTGSISSPWATIAHASTKVSAGATVYVAAGVYNGSFTTSSSGTASAYITYQGETANFSGPVNCAQVAANQGNLSTCPQLVGGSSTTWDNTGNYVAIQGFDVTGGGINGIYTQGNATIISQNHVHNILPSTCNSTGGSGINLNGTNAEVTDNYVHNIGPYPSSCGYVQGIYFLAAGGFADNNISFDNSGFGIQLWHEPSNILLINNTLFNNASGGIVLGTDDSGFTVDYITVSNNIIVNNGGVGVQEEGASSSSTGIHNIYTNNLVYGNSGGAFSLQNGLSASATVTSSPDFVNGTGTDTGNYHLQSSSPALSAATGNGAPTKDFDGNARPQNGRYDIGAYEYMSAGSAALSVSPTVAGFSSQNVGSTSPAQTLTLTNQSSAAVALSGISISGTNSADFSQTNNCGTSVAASASCAIDVTFTPQASGSMAATLTITPSSGTALQVSLSGTGEQTTATVNISPASLSFPSTVVDQSSSIQYSTVTNTSTSTETLSGMTISGQFAFGGTGTCTSTLAVGASCTVSVVFSPTASGTATGAVTLSDSAGTQTIGLSGTGTSAGSAYSVSVSPTSLSFPTTKVGKTSSIRYSTVTNTGTSTVSITGMAISGQFAFSGSGTCASTLASGASCTVGVDFKPTSRGTQTGAVTLTDSAGTQAIGLSGSSR